MVNKMGCGMGNQNKKILISTAVELLTEKDYENDKKHVMKSEVKINGKLIKIYFRPFHQQSEYNKKHPNLH